MNSQNFLIFTFVMSKIELGIEMENKKNNNKFINDESFLFGKNVFHFYNKQLYIAFSIPFKNFFMFQYEGKNFDWGEDLMINRNSLNSENLEFKVYCRFDKIEKIFSEKNEKFFGGNVFDILSNNSPIMIFNLYLIYTINKSKICNRMPFGSFYFDISDLSKKKVGEKCELIGKFNQIREIDTIKIQTKLSGILLCSTKKHLPFFSQEQDVGEKEMQRLNGLELIENDIQKKIEKIEIKQLKLMMSFGIENSINGELNLFYPVKFTFGNKFSLPLDFFQVQSEFDEIKDSFHFESFLLNLIKIVESDKKKKETEFFWDKLQNISKKRTSNLTNEDVDFLNNSYLSFFGKMLRVLPTIFPYSSDFSFFNKKIIDEDVYGDVFSQGSGDCEDFALSVYRLYSAIIKYEKYYSSKILSFVELQKNLWIPFITKAIISTNFDQNLDEMELHTIFCLLPKSKVLKMMSKKDKDLIKNINKSISFSQDLLKPLMIDATARNEMLETEINGKIFENSMDIKNKYLLDIIMKGELFYDQIREQKEKNFDYDLIKCEFNILMSRAFRLLCDDYDPKSLFDGNSFIKESLIDEYLNRSKKDPYYKYVTMLSTNYFINNDDVSFPISFFCLTGNEVKNEPLKKPINFLSLMSNAKETSDEINLVSCYRYEKKEFLECCRPIFLKEKLSFPVFLEEGVKQAKIITQTLLEMFHQNETLIFGNSERKKKSKTSKTTRFECKISDLEEAFITLNNIISKINKTSQNSKYKSKKGKNSSLFFGFIIQIIYYCHLNNNPIFTLLLDCLHNE